MNIQKESTDNHTSFLNTLLFSKILFITILSVGLITKAHALFMVEPHLSTINGKFSIVASDSGKFSGNSYGLRLGYIGQYFMAGVNVEKGHFTYDSTLTPYGHRQFNGGGVGTFLGFHFLNRWRLWTGYLNSALEPVSNKDIRYFGQQVSIGLSYRVFGGWMLNYDYYNNYFTQYEDDITGKTGSLSNNIRVVGNSLSLSFIQIY